MHKRTRKEVRLLISDSPICNHGNHSLFIINNILNVCLYTVCVCVCVCVCGLDSTHMYLTKDVIKLTALHTQ